MLYKKFAQLRNYQHDWYIPLIKETIQIICMKNVQPTRLNHSHLRKTMHGNCVAFNNNAVLVKTIAICILMFTVSKNTCITNVNNMTDINIIALVEYRSQSP